jgi:Uma2 family endonuclease
MPANPYSSVVAGLILTALNNFIKGKDLGYVTGADGGFDVTDDDTLASDVAFITKARQATVPKQSFNPIPPDLVVEVVSPSDLKDPKKRIQRKLDKYLAAKIPLVWYAFTARREVDVYAHGKKVRTADMDETLDGGDVLPGFMLPVRDIFPD